MYFSLTITRVIKSRRMRWAGYVARMEEGRCVYVQGFGGKSLRETGDLESLGIDGRIKMDLKKIRWGRVVWTGLIWLMIWTNSGHL
jgi:hypothetical protein